MHILNFSFVFVISDQNPFEMIAEVSDASVAQATFLRITGRTLSRQSIKICRETPGPFNSPFREGTRIGVHIRTPRKIWGR